MCDAAKPRRANYVYPSKTRVVAQSQWDYRIPNSKEYWEKIVQDVELERRKVRCPSPKIPHLSPYRSESQNSNANSLNRRNSENSLHEVSMELASPAHKHSLDNKKSRAPKFKIARLQPSFSRTLLGEDEKFDRNSLPDKEVSSENQDTSTEAPSINNNSKLPKRPKNKNRIKFSVRCAYKALKLLAPNKNLDFKPKPITPTSGESKSSSTEDAVEPPDKSETNVTEEHTKTADESFSFQEVHEQLRKTWHPKNPVPKTSRFKLDSTSKSLSTSTRFTSGPSPKFVYPEPHESQTQKLLDSIPKLNTITRKVREKCLSCIKKSFEPEPKTIISLPRTIVYRSIFPVTKHVPHFTQFSLESSSNLTPSSTEGSEELSGTEITNTWRRNDVFITSYSHQNALRRSDDVSKTSFGRQDDSLLSGVTFAGHLGKFNSSSKVTPIIPNTTTERKDVFIRSYSHQNALRRSDDVSKTSLGRQDDSGVTFAGYLGKFNKVTPIIPNDTKEVDTNLPQAISKDSKNVKSDQEKHTPTPEQLPGVNIPSTEDPKVGTSLEEESSEDDESQTILVLDDPSKSKYLAACHAPTVLCPSLEPLRALKQRQPTTLQARIALLEGTAGNRDDSSDDTGDETDFPRNPKSQKDVGSSGGPELETIADISLAEAIRFWLAREASKRSADGKSEVREVAFSPDPSKFPSDLPLRRNLEILGVLRSLPEEDVTPVTILETLCKEFSSRAPKCAAHGRDRGRNKIAIKLVELLVDSKRYLRPSEFPSDLVFSAPQPPLKNSRQVRHVLPRLTFNVIAPILGMAQRHPLKKSTKANFDEETETSASEGSTAESIFSLEVNPPTPRSDVSSMLSQGPKHRTKKLNPYAMFLKKPRRKAVTWRPLTERDLLGYDPEATLDSRAKFKMRQICKEFCDWFRSLGGTDAGIDEDVLQDMFEIDFNADVCKSLQVLIREMPTVPTEVALNRQCPEAGELAMTRMHLVADAVAERTPAKVRAFGSSIPWELRHIPPRNAVQKKWLECEHVPRDLETMEVIWKGITHLQSVQSFVQWVADNPQVEMPKALDAIIAMDSSGLGQAEDDEALAQRELDIEQIESFKIR